MISTVAALNRRLPVRLSELNTLLLKRLALLARDRQMDFPFQARNGVIWSANAFPDLLTRHMLFTGTYQEDVLSAVREFVSAGDTVIDVGAHHGLMTVTAAKTVGPTGRVYAFEPSPSIREELQRHLRLNELDNAPSCRLACSRRPVNRPSITKRGA
jgi:hypothetical protein